MGYVWKIVDRGHSFGEILVNEEPKALPRTRKRKKISKKKKKVAKKKAA
jgi:hypothetical protein